MRLLKCLLGVSITACITLTLFSCGTKSGGKENSIADTPDELQRIAGEIIKRYIDLALVDTASVKDRQSLIYNPELVNELYAAHGYSLLWSKEGKWIAAGDSLADFIKKSKLFGLFPEDYHFDSITVIRSLFFADSLNKSDRRDAALWAQADVMFTDAFLQMAKDIKFGRLPRDSVTLRSDSSFLNEELFRLFENGSSGDNLKKVFESLEPVHKGYHLLKQGIPGFLANFDSIQYTFVSGRKDSIHFVKALQRRLFEGGYISFNNVLADSVQLAIAVKSFQKQKGLKVDGKAGDGTLRLLNSSDNEKFIRIAISMDKYKMFSAEMPGRYILVNSASNYMYVYDKGDVKFTSKVICGKPLTRTPLLNSKISEIITYPQWVPPSSIVTKEILPAVKRNPGYLARRGFSLIDSKGEVVDPYSVDWSKYTKSVPFRVVQGSGDANALGIIKFVFANKYAVYLHDTNQRYLFGNSYRSLSHGCVRVQDWAKLAKYIIQTDSLVSAGKDYTRTDSLNKWLKQKNRMTIPVRNKLPVFIRYITCEGKNGKIFFYDDIYNDDKVIREKYFSGK